HTYYVGEEGVLVHNECKTNTSAKKSNNIDYGGLDDLGRPTGINAEITPDMIGAGSPASASIKPPGFGGQASGHARGHLLGNQLGGTGKDPRNLVTIYQNPVNHPVMSGIESKVRKAVEAGQTIRYSVTPVYNGMELIPRGITIHAQGADGFEIFQTIINR
ncbi:MAG: DNA/RNA non-specific endonuclease, partial [Erysipelotrichaceae bacterium]|nr:DNA/RNA non-specific endonuclease [Erysipelotrichaceae bacterium]